MIVLIGLLVLAIPAWRLASRTQPSHADSIPVSHSPTSSADPITLTFTAAPGPEEIQVQILGSHVATVRSDHWPATVTLPIALPSEGIDLVVSATWPQTTEAPIHALRIQATLNDRPLADATLWGATAVTDVVTLNAPPRP